MLFNIYSIKEDMNVTKIFTPIILKKTIVVVDTVSLSASRMPDMLSRPNTGPITADIKAPIAPTSVGVAMPV